MDWITIVLELAAKLIEEWWIASLHGPKQNLFGHRRSIVRLIGTMLPLPQAKRVHLDLAVWRYDNDHDLISSDANSVSSFSDFIDEGRGSICTEAGNEAQSSDMKKLMEEILELKIKMNEILQRQTLNNCCGKSTCCSIADSTVKPPPPPPPPPMPPALPQLFTPRRIEKRIPPSHENSLKPDGLSAVLSELKKSKFALRPVLRSPGGRPLKDRGSESGTPRSDCGGDMLAEILRRRYMKSEITESPAGIESSMS